MTDQEINVAIAETCGWSSFGLWNGNPNQPAAFAPGKHISQPTPNYCHDLNAMHEAEKTLGTHHLSAHAHAVAELTTPDRNNNLRSELDWWLVGSFLKATARQRAEAFLRTIGKWRD